MSVSEELNQANEAEVSSTGRSKPAVAVGLAVIGLFALVLTWQVASDLHAPSSGTGSVAAVITQIAARASGQVQQVNVADNAAVKAGDLLFTLDPRPFELAVSQAESALGQALASVGASEASLLVAQAQVDQARSSLDAALREENRVRELVNRGISARSGLDNAHDKTLQAQSALTSSEASLEASKRQLGGDGGLAPQVESAMLQLEQAKLNLSFARVTAPTDGYVTNLKLAAGQYLNAGTPALTFIEHYQPWIVADFRENQLVNMRPGDAAGLVFDAAPGQQFEGRVRSIAYGIDGGRTTANGLPQNQAANRWFEPARKIPVFLELNDYSQWPANGRAGSKVNVLVHAGGETGLVARVGTGVQWLQSWLSYLY